MLKALLKYFSLAVLVHLITGVLTKVVELLVLGGALTEAQFGVYQHYLLVVEMSAGVFIVGMEHALVTFINRAPENYLRFLAFFVRYGAFALLLGALAAAFAYQRYSTATVLALVALGPFIIAELGKLIFRARLEQAWELSLQGLQSLLWSLGCALSVWLWAKPQGLENGVAWLPSWLPLAWALAGTVLTALIVGFVLSRRLRELTKTAPAKPDFFGTAYQPFWADYRQLWLGGMAFLLNIQVVKLAVDHTLGNVALGRYGYVMSVMLFIHKPLALVQRAALPLFTRLPEEVPAAFRSLVRINLTVFPLLAVFVLGGYDYLLKIPSLQKWDGTWPYLAIVISSAPMFSVEYLVATVAVARGLAANTRRANVTALFVNLPLAWFLVTQYGLMGAASAALAYPMLFGILMFWFNRRDLPSYVKFAAVAILRALFWLWAAISLLWWLGEPGKWFPLAALIYLGGSLLTGLWSPAEIRHAFGYLLGRRDSR
ncbi:MAG: hypothetical protein V3W41_03140 [Planctomycetota bacterium]